MFYGEVLKEVLAARLLDEYARAADFLPTQTVHVERVVGTAEAHAATAMGNASLCLRVGPAPAGTGLDNALGEEVSAATCCRPSTSRSRRRSPPS